jgi:hypothetical protein
VPLRINGVIRGKRVCQPSQDYFGSASFNRKKPEKAEEIQAVNSR